ncbi:MAG: GAF domain-containing protein [candidate division Zixibacteria bacterium]|nr:GAF domain-containing protein [candidate division Zixibacteria bacterium]
MADLTHRTRTEKLLLEAARIFNTTLEYEELIELVLKLVMKAVDAQAALVFRIDHDRTDMKVRFMKRDDSTFSVFYRELGQGVVGWVAQYRQPIIINDPANDPRVDGELGNMSGIAFESLVSVPLVGRGQMIGVVAAINKTDGPFTEADLDILTGLNNQMAVAIDNTSLLRHLKRESLERQALYEVGKKLSSSLELDELLREILTSLKMVVRYDAGGIFLIEPDSGNMKSINYNGYDPAQEEQLQVKFGQGLIGTVANTGEPVIVPDVTADPRYINARSITRSEIVVPIKIDDRVIGVLNLESNELNAYNNRSLALMETFATQAAISLERARLHRDIIEGRKLEQQLSIAREIQQSFLPKKNPVLPGYDLDGRNFSSGQVGGDYYDFIPIVDGHVGIAIADVSGKGVPAALIMASFRASLIAEIRNNYSIRTIGTKVNSLMCESLDHGNFVTGVYGVLDTRNHILTFTNFGHNPPILLRKNGDVEFLREGGPVLGVTTLGIYEERALMIGPGEMMVWYTDGVSEVFDSDGHEFGADRLLAVIKANRQRSARDVADAIYAAVGAFASPDHVFDDLTMVVIKRLGTR